ncbi:hypothetical protein B7Y94_04015 [Candidatus Saccharibacteria bacterium 32-49-12]|nr:MAG: hypothetical protein B7Y94_04015 [Candidatus Saccharibacteria bacterium 32-49-12]
MNKLSTEKIQRILKWIIFWGVLTLMALSIVQVAMHEFRPRQMVSVGGVVLQADVAKTPQELQKGLGGRTSLGRDEAMLFVFESDGPQSIWMKDMKFPLDIIWLDRAKRVVHIERHVQPDAVPHDTYESTVPARYVLEMNAGRANGIEVGSLASFNIAEEGI